MRNLTHYIDTKNYIRELFGDAKFDLACLSQADVEEIARNLDCDLSPENLHCDGEITVQEADRKYRFYSKVYEELNAYCNLNRLSTPAVYEL